MRTRVLVLIGVLAGCGKSSNLYDELLKENEAALGKRLASLRTILDAAKKRPALTPPKLRPVDALGFEGLEETTKLEQSGYQGQSGCHPVYGAGNVFALRAGGGVRQESTHGIEDMLRTEFKAALTPPYAVVCVQQDSEAPKSDGEKHFSGGSYTGECRFFEIESGAYLGGVALSAHLTMALVNSYNGQGLNESMEKELGEEFAKLLPPKVTPPTMSCSWY